MRLVTRALGISLQLCVAVAWFDVLVNACDPAIAVASLIVIVGIGLAFSLPTLALTLDVLSPVVVVVATAVDAVAPGMGSAWVSSVIISALSQACICAV